MPAPWLARSTSSSRAALPPDALLRVGQEGIPAPVFARQQEIVRDELRERGAHDAVFTALRQRLVPEGHSYHRA